MKFPLTAAATLALISSALGAGPATAGVDRWTSLGPHGGLVLRIEVAPSEPDHLYILFNFRGLFRSTDGGVTFSPAGPDDATVVEIEIDPRDPRIVYALVRLPEPESGTEIRRTDDGGTTWEPLAGLPPGSWTSVKVDPRDPGVLFATSYSEGVYRSDDGGATWRATTNAGLGPEPEARDLLFDPTDASVLYLSTSNARFRSTDGGESWLPIGQTLTGTGYLVPVAGKPGTLFLALFSGGFYRSDDHGDTWTEVGPLPEIKPWGLVAGAGVEPPLYVSFRHTAYRSDDGGVSWSPIAEVEGGRPEPRVLAPSPDVPGRIYVGTTVGLFSSEDGGATLAARGGPLMRTGALFVDPRDPATLYAGALGVTGSFRSVDGGQTWRSWGVDLALRSLAFDPTDPDFIYLGTNFIWRTKNGGETWTPYPEEYDFSFEPVPVNALAVDPVVPRIAYAGTQRTLLRTTNRGKTWRPVTGGPPRGGVNALAISPDSPKTVLAGSMLSGVYRSTDKGDTWTRVASSPADLVYALAAAPGGVFYAAWFDRVGVYRSTDGGESFSPAAGGLPAEPKVTSLWVDPASSDVVYAAVSKRGVYRTDDGGASWRRLPTDGLGSLELTAVTAHPSSPGTVHVATMEGVYTMDVVPRKRVLELRDGRFEVEVEWDTGDLAGAGTVAVAPADAPGPVDLRSTDSAVVQFFSPDNWEMLVKVLDGRMVNGHVWVFFAAATNVAFDVRVRDTSCGTTKVYHNALGTAAPAVTDDAAFDDCAEPSPPSCVADAETFCLGPDRRFEVTVEWSDVLGRRARGRQVRLADAGLAQSDDSGLFYFFSEANWEMLVKVLDGCEVNGRFWVFSAATTNVGYRLRVRDTLSGAVSTYVNPAGVSAAAITDTEAFATCN